MLEVGVVRHVGLHERIKQRDLGIADQHRDLGTGQPEPLILELPDLIGSRQAFDLAVETAVLLQPLHQAFMGVEILDRMLLGDGDRQGLVVIVLEHMVRHRIGHGFQQRVAVIELHRALAHHRVQQDLDVDLVVRAVHARRVVDKVRIHAAALAGVLDARRLGDAQIGALADDLCIQFVRIDAQGVIGLVADLIVLLGRRLHIGADAAEPQQLHIRLQKGLDQGRGRSGLRLKSGQFADLVAELDGLGGPRENPAAF